MSARGVKGAAVAKGGTDGSDFSHRQVLAPRYQAMATYRAQLVQLFSVLPFFYLCSVILTAMHWNAGGLKAISATFLPPFYVQLALIVLTAGINLQSIRLQSNVPMMVLAALSSLFLLYLSIMYGWQTAFPDRSKKEEIGFSWYLGGAAVNFVTLLLNTVGLFDGYMIMKLQGSGSKKQ
jgi:hypothetical protein